MISTKYSWPDIAELLELLTMSHNLHIRVRVLDLDHNYREDLSSVFVDGQVNFDADAEITRSLDLTVFDPLRAIQLDPDSPSPLGIFIANQISVVYVISNPTRTKSWDIPVFCGPIEKVDRDGMFLNIKCLGKEVLSLGNLWRGRDYRKGQEKTTVIRSILTSLCGESKLDVPNLSQRLPEPLNLSRSTKPWILAKRLAATMGYQLFYDGRGVARLRRKPNNMSFIFRMKHLTSVPKVGYDLSKTINAVEVIGRKPSKDKDPVGYRLVADRNHRLSPWSLGRGNPKIPRYMWKTIKDGGIRTDAEAKDVCLRELSQGLRAGVDVKFDGVGNPLLEELDVCQLDSEHEQAEFVMRKWTLPLVAGENASYGYLKKVAPKGGSSAVRKTRR